ncbi:hypothetical protein BDF19DRAFT_414094 [Syncephalis fuscata]|nr:hypothetical protein BDF19DRAFT_414094 [Syncephalis fuscata]
MALNCNQCANKSRETALVTKLCALFLLSYFMLLAADIMKFRETWRYGPETKPTCVVLVKLSYIVRTVLVQNTHDNYTVYASALMSSNVDSDADPIYDDSTYYNTTIIYN